jgi:opacity protein-like surface antigen
MNAKFAAILFMYCFLFYRSFSQNYFYNNRYYDKDFLFEINASAGAMNCLTDLGGKSGEGKGFLKDLNIVNTQFSAGISAGCVYTYTLGARLEFNAGTITADDNVLKNDKSAGGISRYKRNLQFRSNIYELLLLVEYYPLAHLFFYDNNHSRFSPYITGGVGLFHFNPQTYLHNQLINLQPLHTEGQGFAEYSNRPSYKLTQVNFPVGAGIKYELSPLCNFRIEVLHRITTTDYLDDVSTMYIDPALFQKYLTPENAALAIQLNDRQGEINPAHTTQPGAIRGRSSKNDSYFTIQFKIAIVLGRERR